MLRMFWHPCLDPRTKHDSAKHPAVWEWRAGGSNPSTCRWNSATLRWLWTKSTNVPSDTWYVRDCAGLLCTHCILSLNLRLLGLHICMSRVCLHSWSLKEQYTFTWLNSCYEYSFNPLIAGQHVIWSPGMLSRLSARIYVTSSISWPAVLLVCFFNSGSDLPTCQLCCRNLRSPTSTSLHVQLTVFSTLRSLKQTPDTGSCKARKGSAARVSDKVVHEWHIVAPQVTSGTTLQMEVLLQHLCVGIRRHSKRYIPCPL